MSGAEVLATLPDGSVVTRQPIDYRSSLIGREVDGVCVWGQAFSAEDHERQVADLIARMVANPGAFVRWWNDVSVSAGSVPVTAVIVEEADRQTAIQNAALGSLFDYYDKRGVA